jgi:hypothetical protein
MFFGVSSVRHSTETRKTPLAAETHHTTTEETKKHLKTNKKNLKLTSQKKVAVGK